MIISLFSFIVNICPLEFQLLNVGTQLPDHEYLFSLLGFGFPNVLIKSLLLNFISSVQLLRILMLFLFFENAYSLALKSPSVVLLEDFSFHNH